MDLISPGYIIMSLENNVAIIDSSIYIPDDVSSRAVIPFLNTIVIILPIYFARHMDHLPTNGSEVLTQPAIH